MGKPICEPIDEALDGRTKGAKRYETVYAELADKFLNGPKTLSQRLKIRSAASLVVRLEEAQSVAASGASFNAAELSELTTLAVAAIREAAPALHMSFEEF